MVALISTVAFQGIEARTIEVQVQTAGGVPAFTIVGYINPPFQRMGKSTGISAFNFNLSE